MTNLRIVGKPHALDEHLHVRRVLPAIGCRNVGPFVFFDHLGPLTLPPGVGFDVRPHPHIGLATVTALLDGEIFHRDSLGVSQVIRPGELNLMVAGAGVTHSERATPQFREHGGAMHGLQLWMALPAAEAECAPWFEHRSADELPTWEQGGAKIRLMLGAMENQTSPVQIAGAPMFAEASLTAGADLTPRVGPKVAEHAVYVLVGDVDVDGEPCAPGTLVVAAPGQLMRITARSTAQVAWVGGAALDGPRLVEWNFVATTRERLDQARADWQAKKFPIIPGDNEEFIPLPTRPPTS